MKDVFVGRVDLVRALGAGGEELQEAVADLLGFERKAEVPRAAKAWHESGQPPERGRTRVGPRPASMCRSGKPAISRLRAS